MLYFLRANSGLGNTNHSGLCASNLSCHCFIAKIFFCNGISSAVHVSLIIQCYKWAPTEAILIWRHHRATCQQKQQSIKSYPMVLIALPPTPAACLLRAWLPVGDMMRVERNHLNSTEWSCGEGCTSLSNTLYPLHPYSHKHPVSLCVMGWSQAPDTPPAHCLHAWVERGCVDTAGVDWGAEKSSDLTGVKAPLSRSLSLPLLLCLAHIHTHMHTHTRAHTRCLYIFLCWDFLKFSPRASFVVVCCTSALLRNVFKLPQTACSSFLSVLRQLFSIGTLLSQPQVSPFLFLSLTYTLQEPRTAQEVK